MAAASKFGCSRLSSCLGSTFSTASSSLIMPSSTRSTAIFSAAASGTLAVTGLEHEQLAALDGVLHVLHVAVVVLQGLGDGHELIVNLGHLLMQLGDRLGVRMPATTSSPCALMRYSP